MEVRSVRLEDYQHEEKVRVPPQPQQQQPQPHEKVLTINGKLLDEQSDQDLAELFPAHVLGAATDDVRGRWTCSRCPSTIEHNSTASYAKHLRGHYKCSQRRRRTKPKNHDQSGDNQRREERPECDICSKNFSQKFHLYRHLQRHTGQFTCPDCLKVYSRKRQLESHRASCRDGDGVVLVCPICRIVAETRAELRRHLLAMHANRGSRDRNPHRRKSDIYDGGDDCYSSSGLLGKNGRITETVVGEEEEMIRKNSAYAESPHYKCSYCEKSYARRHLLDKHVRTKHNAQGMDADKVCFECGKIFHSARTASRHRLEHHTPLLPGGSVARSHKCEDCDRSFVTESMLRQHSIKHDTTRSYSCPYCDDSVVKYRHSLFKHVRLRHKDKCEEFASNRNAIMSKIQNHDGRTLKKSKKRKRGGDSSTKTLSQFTKKTLYREIRCKMPVLSYDISMKRQDEIVKSKIDGRLISRDDHQETERNVINIDVSNCMNKQINKDGENIITPRITLHNEIRAVDKEHERKLMMNHDDIPIFGYVSSTGNEKVTLSVTENIYFAKDNNDEDGREEKLVNYDNSQVTTIDETSFFRYNNKNITAIENADFTAKVHPEHGATSVHSENLQEIRNETPNFSSEIRNSSSVINADFQLEVVDKANNVHITSPRKICGKMPFLLRESDAAASTSREENNIADIEISRNIMNAREMNSERNEENNSCERDANANIANGGGEGNSSSSSQQNDVENNASSNENIVRWIDNDENENETGSLEPNAANLRAGDDNIPTSQVLGYIMLSEENDDASSTASGNIAVIEINDGNAEKFVNLLNSSDIRSFEVPGLGYLVHTEHGVCVVPEQHHPEEPAAQNELEDVVNSQNLEFVDIETGSNVLIDDTTPQRDENVTLRDILNENSDNDADDDDNNGEEVVAADIFDYCIMDDYQRMAAGGDMCVVDPTRFNAGYDMTGVVGDDNDDDDDDDVVMTFPVAEDGDSNGTIYEGTTSEPMTCFSCGSNAITEENYSEDVDMNSEEMDSSATESEGGDLEDDDISAADGTVYYENNRTNVYNEVENPPPYVEGYNAGSSFYYCYNGIDMMATEVVNFDCGCNPPDTTGLGGIFTEQNDVCGEVVIGNDESTVPDIHFVQVVDNDNSNTTSTTGHNVQQNHETTTDDAMDEDETAMVDVEENVLVQDDENNESILDTDSEENYIYMNATTGELISFSPMID